MGVSRMHPAAHSQLVHFLSVCYTFILKIYINVRVDFII